MGKHPSGYRISRQPDKPIDELNPFITENHPRLAAVAPLTLQPAPREVIPPVDAELEQEKDKKKRLIRSLSVCSVTLYRLPRSTPFLRSANLSSRALSRSMPE